MNSEIYDNDDHDCLLQNAKVTFKYSDSFFFVQHLLKFGTRYSNLKFFYFFDLPTQISKI